jgi:recombination protein RecT
MTTLHVQRTPVATRPAATLMLLRDGANGIEVLMTRRSPTASFAPGVYVFPGGALDPEDAAIAINQQQCTWRAEQSERERHSAVAAIREAFEELGILLGSDPRRFKRDLPLAAQLAEQNEKFCANQLFCFSHWVTDRDLPKRFDVLFFAARMPQGQEAIADEGEQFEPTWVSPAAALAEYEAKRFKIIFPTIRTLRQLCKFANVQAVLEDCERRPFDHIEPTCPRGGYLHGREERYQEFELPFGEVQFVSPDGQIVHELEWQHDGIVALRKNLGRLTANNPGMMTGPGTNSYIIGALDTTNPRAAKAAGPVLVIDPGPDLASQITALADACGDHIEAIVCTHSHPDHSPAALPLQALLLSRHGRKVPIIGLPSAPTSTHGVFTPDRVAVYGEILKAGETEVEIIFTPGHAANHLCLLMIADAVLLSGDHILCGTTPVIGPPDGDMLDYLASLDLLMTRKIDYIAPAHGYVIADAPKAMKALKAHRLSRERKVLAGLTTRPEMISAMVANVYDDVPEGLHVVAQRSLLAHLLKLEREGIARRLPALPGQTQERWERVA